MSSGQGSQPPIQVIAPRSLFPQPTPAGYGQPPVRPLTGLAPVGAPIIRPGPRPMLLPRPLPNPVLMPRPVASPVTLVAPASGPIQTPAIIPPKSTTVYVGKIAPSVGDDIIKELLEACGPVKSWKRMEDPDTKALKPFGFCEFEEAEGVIRALNLLQSTSVGGQALLLKCNTGTQNYIDYVNKTKEKEAQNKQKEDLNKMDIDGEEDDAEKEPGETSADAENLALEKIMGIVSNLAETLPAPPEAAAEAFLSKLAAETEHSRDERSSRDRHRGGRRESRDRLEEKHIEAKFEKDREAERREAERAAQENDSKYKHALRKWELHESDIRKHADREKDREHDQLKERSRQCEADLQDPDEDLKPWQRKFYAGSRAAAERKRWRDKELHDDEADRKREGEQIAKRAKHEGENGNAQASPSRSSQPAPVNPRLEDPNDSITQAMMNAAKAPRQTQQPEASPQPSPRPVSDPQAAKAVKKSALAAFGADDDEDKPRQLKTITYSEAEQKAAQQRLPTAKEKASAIKALIAKVPTDTKTVFSYKINWAAFDNGGETLKDKIKNWVTQKTTQLLGMEEGSMISFIMAQLASHNSATKLLQEIQGVLDEEASPFVFKLYRMVIFETLKQEADLQD